MAPLVLPFVARQLITLQVLNIEQEQKAYLLRAFTSKRLFSGLRSLGLHLNSAADQEHREDEGAPVFGEGFISGIANAAPLLEELELLGTGPDDFVRATMKPQAAYTELCTRPPLPMPCAPYRGCDTSGS